MESNTTTYISSTVFKLRETNKYAISELYSIIIIIDIALRRGYRDWDRNYIPYKERLDNLNLQHGRRKIAAIMFMMKTTIEAINSPFLETLNEVRIPDRSTWILHVFDMRSTFSRNTIMYRMMDLVNLNRAYINLNESMKVNKTSLKQNIRAWILWY